jgi:hypothetical protein
MEMKFIDNPEDFYLAYGIFIFLHGDNFRGTDLFGYQT